MTLAVSSEGAAIPALPSFLTILEHWGLHLPAGFPELFLFSLIAMFLLWFPAYLGTRKLTLVPSRLQALLELILEAFQKTFANLMGEKVSPPFVPFLSTLFLYILVMNLLGLVPLFHSPTSSLGTTLALGAVVFVVVQYNGLKSHGPLGYLRELAGEPLWLAPLTLPLHLVGEVIRPLSLALRLFGNILAKEILLAVLVTLAPFAFGIIPLPVQLPILPLGILFAAIQALIFTFLSAIYIAAAVEGHGSGHKKH